MEPIFNTALDFGCYVYCYWKERQRKIGNTQLQKFMYLVYGAMLTWHDRRVIAETPKALPYGPVFSILDNFEEVKAFQGTTNDDRFKNANGDKDFMDTIGNVYDVMGSWSAGGLVTLMHEEGSAWSITKSTPGFVYGDYIQDRHTIEWIRSLSK